MTKQLLTHPSFSKLMIGDVCVARSDKLIDGTYRIAVPGGTFEQVVSADTAVTWMTTQAMAVALGA